LADNQKALAIAEEKALTNGMINNYFDIPTPDGHDNLWKFNNQRKYYQDAMCDYSQQST